MKLCSKKSGCGRLLEESQFGLDKRSADGLRHSCIECRRIAGRARYDSNREQMKSANAEYRRNNLDRVRDKDRMRHVRRRYGIEWSQKAELYDAQHGACRVCCCRMGLRESCVDHDHVTGNVRGLLCRSCNIGIGHLRDDADLCYRAASYLREPPKIEIKEGS